MVIVCKWAGFGPLYLSTLPKVGGILLYLAPKNLVKKDSLRSTDSGYEAACHVSGRSRGGTETEFERRSIESRGEG